MKNERSSSAASIEIISGNDIAMNNYKNTSSSSELSFKKKLKSLEKRNLLLAIF
jgi:hypothetical protein